MKPTIKFILGTWSILVLVKGLSVLMPKNDFIQNSYILIQIQSLNSTGVLFIWAALFSLFVSLGNRYLTYSYIPSLKRRDEYPFDFYEHIFQQYEDRYQDNRKWRF